MLYMGTDADAHTGETCEAASIRRLQSAHIELADCNLASVAETARFKHFLSKRHFRTDSFSCCLLRQNGAERIDIPAPPDPNTVEG